MSETTSSPAPADKVTDTATDTTSVADAPAAQDNVALVGDAAHTLVVASFDSLDDAKAAYEELKEVEDGRTLEVEGVVILTRDTEGEVRVAKVTDHNTRTGMAWGALGGVIVGVLFPPSLIGSAIVGGAAGAVIGKARNIHHKHEIADQLIDIIDPGQAGLVAMVSDPRAVEIEKALAKADDIVRSAIDDVTARELKAAAKEIEDGA